MLALCFAGTYVLLQWDADASLALVAFIMPLFGFLAGILVALLRKKLDWWYCVGMGFGAFYRRMHLIAFGRADGLH